MSGLNEEELIKVLNVCEKIYQGNLQAYYPYNEHKIRLKEFTLRINQLTEIVKAHFKRKEFTRGHEIKQIQQKPTVTREWVYNRVDRELKECEYENVPTSYEIKGMIADILEELGFTIES